MSAEIEHLREWQRRALSDHERGDKQAVLGMSDALMEEVLILSDRPEEE